MRCLVRGSPTHHPDHDVGQAGDPDGGGEEGDHEPSLPAALGTVGDGEEQEQGQGPHGQPLQLVTHTRWREMTVDETGDPTSSFSHPWSTWSFERHQGPFVVVLSLSFLVVLIVLVVLLLVLCPTLQSLQSAPTIQPLLGAINPVLQAPHPLGPGRRVGVTVGDAVDSGLRSVDPSLSLAAAMNVRVEDVGTCSTGQVYINLYSECVDY